MILELMEMLDDDDAVYQVHKMAYRTMLMNVIHAA